MYTFLMYLELCKLLKRQAIFVLNNIHDFRTYKKLLQEDSSEAHYDNDHNEEI